MLIFRSRGSDIGREVVRPPHTVESSGGRGDVTVEVIDGDDAELHVLWLHGCSR